MIYLPLCKNPLTLTTTFTFPPGLTGIGEAIGTTTTISLDLKLGLEADEGMAALTGSGWMRAGAIASSNSIQSSTVSWKRRWR